MNAGGVRLRMVASARVSRRCSFVFFGLFVLAGCSADKVPEPEPTLETKGAFIAVATDDGGYDLYRSLAVIGVGHDDDAFFVVPYLVEPTSFDEAREMAKDPALPAKPVIAISRNAITSHDWRVVWFRSVSSEEEAAFR
jgi:hypothetical protein